MPFTRLICPFIARIRRIDFEATGADPDGAGPFTSGYDHLFRRTRQLPAATQVGTSAIVLKDAIDIPVQVRAVDQARLDQGISGDTPVSELRLIATYKDLRRLGLVLENGSADIGKQDRLVAILRKNGQVVQEADDRHVHQLYVHQARDCGWGLSLVNPSKNLLELTLRSRERSSGG